MRLITILAVFALVLTGQHAGAQGYSPPGSITVTPPTPAPGDIITVTVEGCGSTSGIVDVFIDGVFVGTATVEDGSFTQDFVVPLEAQGPVNVEVFCDDIVLASIIDVTRVMAATTGVPTGTTSTPMNSEILSVDMS